MAVVMVFMMVIVVMILMVVMVLMVEMRVMVVRAMMIMIELVKLVITVSQGVTKRIIRWPGEVINGKEGLYLNVVGGLGCGWGMGQLRSHSLQCCSLGSH